ncbi:MAG: TetR/AcrR family transcriptional regulator [Chlorobi bacterium]|nr:TetR/AcrR family transcriptional regulator [Chlorobiota bacterium]
MQTDRQREIVEVALDLIANKGIQGLTIKNLSKAIGISEPAIYRHFESKTAILMTILNNFKEMADLFSGLMDTYEGSAIEKIGFMFQKMPGLFTETPSMVSVVLSEEIFKNDDLLKNKIVEIMNLYAETIEKIILKGQKEKNVRADISVKSLALLTMGSLRLLVKRRDLNDHDFDLNREGNKMIGVLNKILEK